MDEDNIRMSEFIELKFGQGVYRKGAAFYEYTQEEDLLSYREIVHIPKDKLQYENGGLLVSIALSILLYATKCISQ